MQQNKTHQQFYNRKQRVLKWPSQTPELNMTTEMLWWDLKRAINRQTPANFTELKSGTKFWHKDSITKKVIYKTITSSSCC